MNQDPIHPIDYLEDTLGGREAVIFVQRHILYPRRTLKQIATKFNISPERVRQLSNRAIQKIVRASRLQESEDMLYFLLELIREVQMIQKISERSAQSD